jgi:hypothetical protein
LRRTARKKISLHLFIQKVFTVAGDVVQWYSVCLACMRPWIKFPVLKKGKKITVHLVASNEIGNAKSISLKGLTMK